MRPDHPCGNVAFRIERFLVVTSVTRDGDVHHCPSLNYCVILLLVKQIIQGFGDASGFGETGADANIQFGN